MKNKDVNIDYQKVVRVGDKKWDTIKIIFSFWDSLFFYTGSFQVTPVKKTPPLKKPVPTQNPNLT